MWYIAGIDWTELPSNAPHILWIDHALEADYRRNPKWQDPSIVSHYTGKDLYDGPHWEPGERAFMERIWWVGVATFILLVTGGLIWGLMNSVGFLNP